MRADTHAGQARRGCVYAPRVSLCIAVSGCASRGACVTPAGRAAQTRREDGGWEGRGGATGTRRCAWRGRGGVLVSQAKLVSRRARVPSKARLHVRDGGARGVHGLRRARHEACTTVHAMPARFRWLRTAARKTAVRIGCGRLVAPSVACVGIPRLPTRVGSLLVLGVPAARCVTVRTREASSLLVPARGVHGTPLRGAQAARCQRRRAGGTLCCYSDPRGDAGA